MKNPLEDLQAEVTKKAVAMIDTDKIALKLSKKLSDALVEGVDSFISDSDMAYWIKEELTDEDTPAGKAYAKAISSIASKMAKAIK